MYEAKLKAGYEYLKVPGGAHLLGQGGIPGMDMDADPTVMQGVIDAGDTAQAAKNLADTGKGYEGLSNAGVTIPTNYLPGLAGTPATQTQNVKITTEGMRDQAMLGAASIRAAGSGDKTKINVPYKFRTADGQDVTVQVPIPLGATPDEANRRVLAAGQAAGLVYPQGSGVPGQTSAGGSAPAQPPPPRQGAAPPGNMPAPQPPPNSTNLPPMAQTDPGKTGKLGTPAAAAAMPPAPAQTITDPAMQAKARQAYALITDPKAKLDIQANTKGAIMPLQRLSTGKLGFVGKFGGEYPIPPAAGVQ